MIEFRAMGCYVSIQLEATNVGNLLQDISREIASIESSLTRFNAHSELMRFNQQSGKKVFVDDVLFENIICAKETAEMTDGLYNPLILPALLATGYDKNFDDLNTPENSAPPTILDWQEIQIDYATQTVQIPHGSAIDLGGIAKGWTAMYVADQLEQYGACLVNMGGDMVGRGAPTGWDGWPVEIEDPINGNAFTSICLKNQSIATSGTNYRNWKASDGQIYHHIIDPRNGLPADSDVLTVSVIHIDGVTAEAFTKAVLLQGAKNGLDWLNQQENISSIVFQRDGKVLSTNNFMSLIHERNQS